MDVDIKAAGQSSRGFSRILPPRIPPISKTLWLTIVFWDFSFPWGNAIMPIDKKKRRLIRKRKAGRGAEAAFCPAFFGGREGECEWRKGFVSGEQTENNYERKVWTIWLMF